MHEMSDSTNRTERFTVEGFFEGDWHLVMSSDEQETAIRGAGSVVISGAFEFVRIMLNGVVPGVGRELVRIDQNGTVRNGAFVEEITPEAPAAPAAADQEANVSKRKSEKFRPAAGVAAAVALFVAGLAIGNWAIQVI
ncbi:MAG: hypothetical protein CMM59_02860 [Rhodospirillaceae bacterium]|nr:hypothetical protein [Rhodospirillaceae bacterium]|tara:strand:- start:495 stop:908 length:414 start_codon:yes stop_codon:yes gene_type:complete